jgi:hypothetical protein
MLPRSPPPIETDDALLTAGGGRRSGKIDAMEPGAHCSAMTATRASQEKIDAMEPGAHCSAMTATRASQEKIEISA